MATPNHCAFCGMVCEASYCNSDCYQKALQRDSYQYLSETLLGCIGKILIGFDVSKDGHNAILTFEEKTIIIGANPNEVFPTFKIFKKGEKNDE